MADLEVTWVSGFGSLSHCFLCNFIPPTHISWWPPRCLAPINFPLSCPDPLLLLGCLGSSLQLTARMPPSCSSPRCDPFQVPGHCCQTLSASLAASAKPQGATCVPSCTFAYLQSSLSKVSRTIGYLHVPPRTTVYH